MSCKLSAHILKSRGNLAVEAAAQINDSCHLHSQEYWTRICSLDVHLLKRTGHTHRTLNTKSQMLSLCLNSVFGSALFIVIVKQCEVNSTKKTTWEKRAYKVKWSIIIPGQVKGSICGRFCEDLPVSKVQNLAYIVHCWLSMLVNTQDDMISMSLNLKYSSIPIHCLPQN